VGVSWIGCPASVTSRRLRSMTRCRRCEDGLVGRLGRPAQDNPQPGHQLTHPKWLGQVIIRPGIQGSHLFRLLLAHREDNNGILGPLAQLAGHFEAIDVGQAQIENHQVRPVGNDAIQRLLAVAASKIT